MSLIKKEKKKRKEIGVLQFWVFILFPLKYWPFMMDAVPLFFLFQAFWSYVQLHIQKYLHSSVTSGKAPWPSWLNSWNTNHGWIELDLVFDHAVLWYGWREKDTYEREKRIWLDTWFCFGMSFWYVISAAELES